MEDAYVLNELKEFMKKLKSNKNAYLFLQPIEEIVNTLPDYSQKIKHPTDLLKIDEGLNTLKYSNIDDFKNDLDIMINNCITYNHDTSNWVYKVCLQFSEFYTNNWAKLIQKINKHQEKATNIKANLTTLSTLKKPSPMVILEMNHNSHPIVPIPSTIINASNMSSNAENNIQNITVFTNNEDEKIAKRIKNLFTSIKQFLNLPDENRDGIISLIVKSISKRNKSFDQIYDDTIKFVTKHLTQDSIKSKFSKKFRKLLRLIKEEQNAENAKMDGKALNIKIDLNENEEKREEKDKLEQMRKEVMNFVDNQKIPEVFRDMNEYPIEPSLRKKILSYVLDIRASLTNEESGNGMDVENI